MRSWCALSEEIPTPSLIFSWQVAPRGVAVSSEREGEVSYSKYLGSRVSFFTHLTPSVMDGEKLRQPTNDNAAISPITRPALVACGKQPQYRSNPDWESTVRTFAEDFKVYSNSFLGSQVSQPKVSWQLYEHLSFVL